MGKGYRSRKEGVREPKRKVIIVCEGKKKQKENILKGSGQGTPVWMSALITENARIQKA